MSDVKHTPWTTDGDDEGWSVDYVGNCGYAAIFDADGDVVAFAVTTGTNDRDAERRATIISAVNAHDDLVEALREARPHVKVHRNDFGEVLNDEAQETLAKIDAALSRASSKP